MRLLGNDPDLGAATPEDDLPAYPAPDYSIDETGRYVDASSRAADPSDSRPVEADNLGSDPSEGPPAVVVPEPEPLADAGEQDPVDGDSVPAPADPALVEPAPVVDPDQPPLLLDAADHTGDWGFAADPVTPEAPSLAQFGWDSEAPSDPEPPAWTAGRDLFEPPAPAAEDTTALPWFLHDDPAPDESLNQPADSLAAQEADPDALDARMDELATPAQETWDGVPPEEPTDLPPVTDDVPAPPQWSVTESDDDLLPPAPPVQEPIDVDGAEAAVDGLSPTDVAPEEVVAADVPSADPWFLPPDPQPGTTAQPEQWPAVDQPAPAEPVDAEPHPTADTDWTPDLTAMAAVAPTPPPTPPTAATVPPSEAPLEPAPVTKRGKKGKEPPSPADISSVGVAILPGVPLPDWVTPPPPDVAHRTGDAEPVPGLPTDEQAPSSPPDVAVVEDPVSVPASGLLPPPDPAQWSEHPWGPVVWGADVPMNGTAPAPAEPVSPTEVAAAVGVADPPPAALPPEAGPPAGEAPIRVDPPTPIATEGAIDAPPPATTPVAAADEFGWLYQPDDNVAPTPHTADPVAPQSPPQDPPPAPPVQQASAAVPPAGAEAGEVAVLTPLAAPPTGPMIPAPAPAPAPETFPVAPADAVDVASTPDQVARTEPASADGVPPMQEPHAESDDGADEGGRTSGAMKWILLIGGLLILLAGVAYAAFVTPGFLSSSATTGPPTLATPPQAAGLTKTSKAAEPATGVFTAMASAEAATGSQTATYSGNGVVATAWVANDAAATPDSLAGAYRASGGEPVKEWVSAPAGPRGGSMKCGAVSASHSVCVWSGDGVVGATDITGSGRSEAGTLTGQMRIALEQPTAA